VFLVFYTRYKILAPTEAEKAGEDMKKVCQTILDAVNLDAESYRLGHTKACSDSSPTCTSVLPPVSC
jgi:myosin heavy subunit